MKRIVFISICARSRLSQQWTSDDEEMSFVRPSREKMSNERFWGWEGAEGAGARALGISVKPKLVSA